VAPLVRLVVAESAHAFTHSATRTSEPSSFAACLHRLEVGSFHELNCSGARTVEEAEPSDLNLAYIRFLMTSQTATLPSYGSASASIHTVRTAQVESLISNTANLNL
jgi:hypothetical protein